MITRRIIPFTCAVALCAGMGVRDAAADDQIFFPARDNVTNQIVALINNETVRVDVSAWYLTERAISAAIANKFLSGVPVRVLGDSVSIFQIDQHTKDEFYWLASQGVPIRLRVNPTWFPEIDHWKVGLFKGQGKAEFGSPNWDTFELAPWSSTNYDDETAMVTDDPALVAALETKFDQMWNDTMFEPESIHDGPPYFKNWSDACAAESTCDFLNQYPNPAPMYIDTSRLEADNAAPPDLIFGQGPDFNNRLVAEINNENSAIDFVIYRLTVPDITNALLAKRAAGVPIRVIVEPNQYLNPQWPEYWLTHANVDQLWASGIPVKQRQHEGMTHMKMLVTSAYATNASSNYAGSWQRDADYFVPRAAKPAIWQAMKDRFQVMWSDTTGFTDFAPQPPAAPSTASPGSGDTGVDPMAALTWNIAPFATSYDVYVGSSPSDLSLVGSVPAELSNNPPSTYSWAPSAPFAAGTTYYWQIVSRTFAGLSAASSFATFTTQ
jgi:hypothetical protein